MRGARQGSVLLLLLLLLACQSRAPDPGTQGTASAHSAGKSGAEQAALQSAELRRDSAAIGREMLSSRDVTLRRSAARALSRIADARAAELLLLALSDEDPEVCTWGAYGLGYACLGRETRTVHALVSRAASLSSDAGPAPLESPAQAISDALGRCASPEAESTLRAWLHGPKVRAEAAALALGRVAEKAGKLDDSTLVALLDAADRVDQPVQNALFPVTRLATLNPSTAERTRTIAEQLIERRAAGSEFALRALSRAGTEGRAAIVKLAARAELAPGLRAQAVRELSALGGAGQAPLWTVFDSFATPPSAADLESANYGPLRALLDALSPPPASNASTKLQALAELALGDQDPPGLKRRKVQVRCAAAALLSGSNFQNPRLLACDPAPDSQTRELSVLRVIGRGKLSGPRKRAYLERARVGPGPLREAALDLLAEHAELGEAYQLLADALAAKSPGVVASAARLLASYPERATRVATEPSDAPSAPNPDPSVVKALTAAYTDARAASRIEVQSLLLDAIGALQLLSLKEATNLACLSDNPTLREHAQKALGLLGERARRCDTFKPGVDSPPGAPSAGDQSLTFETDAGTLTMKLDARFAPNAVSRIVALAQAGFYDGLSVHRVVPGFVAQFGDPDGDGYGGDARLPLRCETSPIEFQPGAVGVALAGRDTGSSQLFVTLGRYPHLDGQYAWLGQAGPGWDRVAAGDRILHVRVSPAP
jgi:cyclophilin family peptidyl-prolyl cis-trans isomerase/HEAT repeat protein